ncbi:MAG: NYN domain-containing protein [Scytonema sp. PMC 1070.18]|nr:NYN domain-containing protein [Scytonema sp. PMC 1070.18]
MACINLASTKEVNLQKSLVHHKLWDLENVKLKPRQLCIFTKKLQQFAQDKGRIGCQNVYYHSSQYKSQAFAQSKQALETLNYKFVDVRDRSKNSADKQLITDCVNLVAPKPFPKTIILVLGDWDYAGLISVLKALTINVIVFAQRNSTSPRLINLVGEENFHYVEDFLQKPSYLPLDL